MQLRAGLNATMKNRPVTRVGYLGPQGSYTHLAARTWFHKDGSRLIAYPQSNLAIKALIDKRVDFSVVPIENTTGGTVNDSLDGIIHGNLPQHGYSIVDELHLQIHLALLGRQHGEKIRKIYSHEYPLKHCSEWIRRNLPDVHCEKAASTSQAAILASKEKGAAAIGTTDAARIYHLKVLQYPLEPKRPNLTSFFVLGKTNNSRNVAKGKIALSLVLSHEPGSLYRALGVLAANRLNMTRIESRPLTDRPWEYTFFIEFEGRRGTAPVRNALDRLARQAHAMQVLGNYAVRYLDANAR